MSPIDYFTSTQAIFCSSCFPGLAWYDEVNTTKLMEFVPLIGEVVRVCPITPLPSSSSTTTDVSSSSLETNDVTETISVIGVLCSIDPTGSHVVLLRLVPGGDGAAWIHTVTMLHRASFQTLEPADPVPLEWTEQLERAVAKKTLTAELTASKLGKKEDEEEEDSKKKKEEEEEEEESEDKKRREATLELLKRNGIVSVLENKRIVAFGGCLSIHGPLYDAASCKSSNPVVLRRMRALLNG